VYPFHCLPNHSYIFSSWAAIDKYSARFLLGDSFGRLAMLSLDDASTAMVLIPLGEVVSNNMYEGVC